MSQNLTIDDIWKLFQETNRLFQESELKAQAAQARMEHDLQETRRLLQEADAKAQARQARMEHDLQESRAETERKSQETDKKIKEVTALVGRLGGRWGEFVEGLVAPACETLFAQRGIPIHQVSP
ncbi:MAG: hypothetical protein H7833_20815, partial [Magnetococcus sp. DMHC-1]